MNGRCGAFPVTPKKWANPTRGWPNGSIDSGFYSNGASQYSASFTDIPLRFAQSSN